jgi:hypothetical protein
MTRQVARERLADLQREAARGRGKYHPPAHCSRRIAPLPEDEFLVFVVLAGRPAWVLTFAAGYGTLSSAVVLAWPAIRAVRRREGAGDDDSGGTGLLGRGHLHGRRDDPADDQSRRS